MAGQGKQKFVERSLVIVKPDGVQRGLVGEVITRLERKGLKLVAMKMVWPTVELAKKHYDMPVDTMKLLGDRTIAAYKEKGIDDKRDPMDIARDIIAKLAFYLSAGPVVVMVVEGAHAVANVRKVRGHTNPMQADIGSISADYSIDSYFISDEDGRAIRNLVHASGNVEEAENEIKIWFRPEELVSYNMAIEAILYDKAWEDTYRDLIKKK